MTENDRDFIIVITNNIKDYLSKEKLNILAIQKISPRLAEVLFNSVKREIKKNKDINKND